MWADVEDETFGPPDGGITLCACNIDGRTASLSDTRMGGLGKESRSDVCVGRSYCDKGKSR